MSFFSPSSSTCVTTTANHEFYYRLCWATLFLPLLSLRHYIIVVPWSHIAPHSIRNNIFHLSVLLSHFFNVFTVVFFFIRVWFYQPSLLLTLSIQPSFAPSFCRSDSSSRFILLELLVALLVSSQQPHPHFIILVVPLLFAATTDTATSRSPYLQSRYRLLNHFDFLYFRHHWDSTTFATR